MRTKSLRIRWSLRIMLIAILILAIPLGILSNRASRQRNAASEIQALHGLVIYDKPRASFGLDRFLGRDYFADAISVKFFWWDYEHRIEDLPVYYEVSDMDAILPAMKRLPRLKFVTLYHLRQAPWVEKYKLELPQVKFEIVE